MNKLFKAGCIAIYLVALAALAVDLPMGIGPWFQRIALLFLAIHVLELVAMFKYVKAYQGPLWESVLQTLLFGLLHWMPIAKAHPKKSS